MSVEEFFKSVYTVCASSNSYGGKLRQRKVEEFKRRMDKIAKKKSGIANFIIKYEFEEASISFIPPNSVVITMKKVASLDEVKELLDRLLQAAVEV